MTCPYCRARNSPAAFECHNCEAPLRDGPEYLKEHAASTWQALARRLGVPALAALLLLGAAHGGGRLGDWYVRQAPVAPVATATPGPTITPRATPTPTATASPTATPTATATPTGPDTRPILDKRSALGARYEAWKQAHGRPVKAMMAFYSTQLRLFLLMDQPYNVDELRKICVQVRKDHAFDGVQDVRPPRISNISPFGTRVTITARHRYNHSSGLNLSKPSYGDRTLVWEQQNGQWLIVEDHFPTTYSLTP